MKSPVWGGGGSRIWTQIYFTSKHCQPFCLLPLHPRPIADHTHPMLNQRYVQFDPVFAFFPEMKGGWHTELVYLLLVFILPVLVYLGLKIHLPWR